MYEPKPIDTSHVEVPKDLAVLIEVLAENTHDVWAKQRIADGWRYGPNKEDDAKTHPCLVPYDQLSLDEQDKDRNAVRQIPAMLARVGFQVHCLGPLQRGQQEDSAK